MKGLDCAALFLVQSTADLDPTDFATPADNERRLHAAGFADVRCWLRPETSPDALHMSRTEFEREARLAMAARLFETGRLSSGQAPGLIGMGRVAFLAELGRLRVSTIQVGVGELDGDLAAAEAAADHPQ